jgi:hypothetical protein
VILVQHTFDRLRLLLLQSTRYCSYSAVSLHDVHNHGEISRLRLGLDSYLETILRRIDRTELPNNINEG